MSKFACLSLFSGDLVIFESPRKGQAVICHGLGKLKQVEGKDLCSEELDAQLTRTELDVFVQVNRPGFSGECFS